MPRLHSLLQSLVTTIVRYHVHEAKNTEIPEEIIVQSLLDAPKNETISSLRDMLTSLSHCKENTLYQYILSGIQTLQSFLQTKEAIADVLVMRAEDSLTQLITNIQTLLITSHHTILPITYHEFGREKHLDIGGLLYKGWFSNALTPSGKMLCDAVFPILKLPTNALPETVASTLKTHLQKHQKKVTEETEIEQLKQENVRLKYRLCGLLPASPRATIPSIMEIIRQRSNSNPMPMCISRHSFYARRLRPPPLDVSEATLDWVEVEAQENSP